MNVKKVTPMQITEKDNIHAFLNIAKQIEKEASLWRFIYIEGLPKAFENGAAYIKPVLTRTLITDHITITAFSSGDIFILTKGDTKDINNTIDSLKSSFQKIQLMPQISFFDLSIKWSSFVAIVKEKVKQFPLKKRTTEKEIKQKTFNPNNFELTVQDLNIFKEKKLSNKEESILLVDDEPLTLNVISQSLHDYNTMPVGTPEEALSLYFSKAPSIVFLDIDMPTCSGYDILKIIKKYDPDACIIMLSGNSYAEQIKQAISLGAKGFVGKPFSRQKLLDYVKKNQIGG